MNSVHHRFTVRPWLAPSVRLMQRFRMSVKLATMAALLLVPLLFVGVEHISTMVADYRVAQSEADGAQAVTLIADVVTEVQAAQLAVCQQRQLPLILHMQHLK